MSRAELAEAVNDHLWRTTGKRHALDAHAIARYERGKIGRPSTPYRSGFRAVLGADSDSELGFQSVRRRGSSASFPDSRMADDGDGDRTSDGDEASGWPPRADAGAGSGASPRVAEALDVLAVEEMDGVGAVVDGLGDLVVHYSHAVTTQASPHVYEELLDVRRHAGAVMTRFGRQSRRRTDLVAAVGWLANLLAVATSYQGNPAAALVWCRDAERRGQQAAHPELKGWAELSRAMIAYYQGHAQRSATIARRALHTAPVRTAVSAKLAAQEMRARGSCQSL